MKTVGFRRALFLSFTGLLFFDGNTILETTNQARA